MSGKNFPGQDLLKFTYFSCASKKEKHIGHM